MGRAPETFPGYSAKEVPEGNPRPDPVVGSAERRGEPAPDPGSNRTAKGGRFRFNLPPRLEKRRRNSVGNARRGIFQGNAASGVPNSRRLDPECGPGGSMPPAAPDSGNELASLQGQERRVIQALPRRECG